MPSHPAASAFVVAAMAIIPAAVAFAGAWVFARARDASGRGRRFAIALAAAAAWMGATALVARSGVLLDFARRPPPMMLVMLACIAVALAIGLGPAGGRLARGLPLAALVGFQSFRLPLELVMHQAAREGVMPVQMSFSGWNFDIVTGASAAGLALLLAVGRAPRALVVAWNVLGAALLANIGAIAVASMPTIHAFGVEPARLNTWVGELPFVWLPAVLVVAALAGHVVVARRLVLDARSSRVGGSPVVAGPGCATSSV